MKIFKAGKDESLRAELDIPQFLFECRTTYKLAAKSGIMDNFDFVEEQHKALAVFLENQKESNGTASAMPPHRPVAGPSKVVLPPIPHATRPKTPPPAPPAQAAVSQKSKPKSTALMSMVLGLSNLRAEQTPVQALRTSTAQPAASKITPQQAPQPVPSTSTARPAPSGPVLRSCYLITIRTIFSFQRNSCASSITFLCHCA